MKKEKKPKKDGMKICSTCGDKKPIIEFNRYKKGKDGRSEQCIDCVQERDANNTLEEIERNYKEFAEIIKAEPGMARNAVEKLRKRFNAGERNKAFIMDIKAIDIVEQLTEYDKPAENIHSHYGRIQYQEWCEKECERINKNPERKTIVHQNAEGKVCICETQKNGKPRWMK
jgi:hypothetical protein